MNNLQSLQSGLKTEEVQLPLKGFQVPLKSPKKNWERSIEGMGDGRFRVHTVKKR